VLTTKVEGRFVIAGSLFANMLVKLIPSYIFGGSGGKGGIIESR